VSADSQGNIRFWDIASGDPCLAFTVPHADDVALSADGRKLAVGSNIFEWKSEAVFREGDVSLYDAATGTQLARIADWTSPIHVLAFTPDGKDRHGA
jgi:WD40 repeat protein